MTRSADASNGNKGAATRERLSRAAMQLFVAHGITATTTRQIAEAAGLAEGTMYRHFESKDALAHALYLEQHLRLAGALQSAAEPMPSTRAKADAIVRTYCRLADEDWTAFAYHLLYQYREYPRLHQIHRGPVEVVRDVIREGMQRSEIPERDLELAVGMALGVVLQTAIQRLYGMLEGRLSAVAPTLSMAVWRVLSADDE